jgi:hypothetical protein
MGGIPCTCPQNFVTEQACSIDSAPANVGRQVAMLTLDRVCHACNVNMLAVAALIDMMCGSVWNMFANEMCIVYGDSLK